MRNYFVQAFSFQRPIELLFRLILGGIFLYLGIQKAQAPLGFLDDIRNMRVLVDPWAALAALTMPWLEIFVGIAIILRVFYSGALALTLSMLLVFVGVILSLDIRGIDASCGCYGKAFQADRWVTYTIQGILIGFVLLLMVLSAKNKPSVERSASS